MKDVAPLKIRNEPFAWRRCSIAAAACLLALPWPSIAADAPQPVVRLAELVIEGEHLAAYRSSLREEIATSVRIEPGVLMLYAVAIKGKPNIIRLTEVYADQQSYEAHIRSPHFIRYKTATAQMVRSLTQLDTDPIMLESKSSKP